jgi:hypothetical protein
MTKRSAETAASRAVRAGAPGIGSSSRFCRPRGPLCGRGYCGQCGITTAAGPVLAAQVSPEHAASSLRDLSSAPPLAPAPPRGPVRSYEEIDANEVMVGVGDDRRDAFVVDPGGHPVRQSRGRRDSGGWPGQQSYAGLKGSGSTNRGGLGPRYVAQFLREQGRNIVKD